MMDVANYPKQTTLSVLGCEDTGMEEVITTFMDACRMVFEEKGQQVEIYPEMFKTANAGRKMGGLISFATKLAQKPEPGFTVDGLEDEYKIFLVAGQYRDSISFDVYCQTLFALKKGGFGKRQREYEYKGSRYERALNYVAEAFKAFTADDE